MSAYGLVVTHNGNVRPFFNCRKITKGRQRGRYQVELFTGRKTVVVEETAIRRFPKEETRG